MPRILTLSLAFILLCLNGFSQQETPYVPGELIVMMEKGYPAESVTAVLQRASEGEFSYTVKQCLSEKSGIYLLSTDVLPSNENQILAAVRRMPAVRAAQFNHYVSERATVPNDTNFGNQWHHVNSNDSDIDSDLAWDITTGGTTATGDEIVVCVIEPGGANYNHVDLIDNHWTNTAEIDGNGIDDDGNGFVDDVNGWNPGGNNDNVGTGGHGTAVSGMIGAKGNNGNGGAGVNWDVKIMQVRVGSLSESNVIAAYNYPYVMRDLYNSTGGAQGAFVVATNASWGIDNANPANYPVWCAFYDDLGAVGILNCGATANNNVNIDVVGDMPTGCGSDYMIAVTASNVNDVRTFSGYGATTIDLAAPGESVYLPSGSTGYSNTSGTSFASPCVAGGIGLVYSAPCPDLATTALSNPQLAADQVRGYILNGVDVVSNLVGETVTGGRLNVRNSLDLALGNCGPLPPCEPIGIDLGSECYLDGGSGSVMASITVSATLSENWCSATSVCYQADGGNLICDDLIALGADLNNANSYTIFGLASNTTYSIYYTTADGTSGTATITTGACDSQVPGCTDTLATNFDPNATFNDGSCTYPCTEVTFTVNTDCWGGEVSWNIQDDQGNVLNNVAFGTYGNQQSFTWTQCIEWGCYTVNILDSFGDGLAGIASGCAIDGSYSMTDDQGNILFEMGTPNYGSSVSHTFCVPGDLPGCTDPSACNYNAAATLDDGSCVLPNGCTDAAACNYNPAATCDDGSCILPNGCTDAAACNYDPAATCDDGSCVLPNGCTDENACNFDPSATCDDGSCEFESCAPCFADFNADGARNVTDLLMMISEFGCTNGCTTDLDNDGMVTSADVVSMLSVFATFCP